jgi:hypothetical protein
MGVESLEEKTVLFYHTYVLFVVRKKYLSPESF